MDNLFPEESIAAVLIVGKIAMSEVFETGSLYPIILPLFSFKTAEILFTFLIDCFILVLNVIGLILNGRPVSNILYFVSISS